MGFFKKIFDKSKPRAFTNQYHPDFGSMTEMSQISGIFEWTFNPKKEIAVEAANTIHRLLNVQTVFKNKSLYHSLKFIHLKRIDLQKFHEFDTEIQNSLFCIASMNSNGYTREEALRFLLEAPTQKTIPFILFRLADWVLTIRQTAELGVRQLIQHQEPQVLIKHHKIIDWLLKVKRTDLKEIHQEITEFIFSEENINQIAHNLYNYAEGDRYYIYRNLIARDKLDEQILDKILKDPNYLIRLLAIRNTDLIERPEILKKLLKDRSQKIRNYAINKIPEPNLPKFQTELHNLLFDRSITIRATSRLLISKFSKPNYIEIYRLGTAKKPTSGCIIGLSEVGNKSDIETIREFLSSDSGKLRAASLYAISNLDYELAKKMAFDLLNDYSNAVKKVCVNLITKDKSHGDLSNLRSIYDHGTDGTKRFVLKTINNYGGWGVAGDFLKGINAENEKINQTAFGFMKSWYNYSIGLSTEQKKEEIEYVLGIYNNMNFNNLNIPYDIRKITDEIPFIFGKNKKN